MGLDCYCKLIVGKIIVRDYVEETVTKYDEETGKPYFKIVSVDKWFYEDKSVFNLQEEDENLHHTGVNNNFQYVGYTVAETESHRHEEPSIKIDSSIELIQQLQEKFKKKYNKEPDVYLITVLSY